MATAPARIQMPVTARSCAVSRVRLCRGLSGYACVRSCCSTTGWRP